MRIQTVLLMAFTTFPVAMSAQDPVVPQGPEFRIETEVFEDDNPQPLQRRLVLFDSGVIYELWLDDNRSATMFDPARKRIILIDRANLEQAVVTPQTLLDKAARVRAEVQQSGRADFFGLNAEVQDIQVKDNRPACLLEFGDTRYESTMLDVNDKAIPEAYYEYSVLAARLGILRQLGLPPFAKLKLCKHITGQGALPLSTALEIRQGKGLKKVRYRSQLHMVNKLSNRDRERIHEVGEILAKCKVVPMEEFRQ